MKGAWVWQKHSLAECNNLYLQKALGILVFLFEATIATDWVHVNVNNINNYQDKSFVKHSDA